MSDPPDTLVSICAGENVRTGFLRSMIELVSAEPRIYGWVITEGGPILSKLRNINVRNSLTTEAQYLLSVDSDIQFTREDVAQLFRRMEAEKADVVSGVYANDQGVIMTTGAGFMLARRAVFEKIGEGWFDVKEREFETGQEPGKDGEAQYGEDISFYLRAREAGFTVIHAPDIRVAHLKVVRL